MATCDTPPLPVGQRSGPDQRVGFAAVHLRCVVGLLCIAVLLCRSAFLVCFACGWMFNPSPLRGVDVPVQDIAEEDNFWEFEFPLWKRLPAYCSVIAPQPLRFDGSALLGSTIAFSARLSPTLDDRLVGSPVPLLLTLAAADDSLPEIYAAADLCAPPLDTPASHLCLALSLSLSLRPSLSERGAAELQRRKPWC